MGLKERTILANGITAGPIKSDQNGIESFSPPPLNILQQHVIKSDQNGIESATSSLKSSFVFRIKSDQNGIERA